MAETEKGIGAIRNKKGVMKGRGTGAAGTCDAAWCGRIASGPTISKVINWNLA